MNDRAMSSSTVACASSRNRPRTLRLAPARGSSFWAMTRTESRWEVMAVELDNEKLLVIHAMTLRNRYRKQYEEAMKWRR